MSNSGVTSGPLSPSARRRLDEALGQRAVDDARVRAGRVDEIVSASFGVPPSRLTTVKDGEPAAPSRRLRYCGS